MSDKNKVSGKSILERTRFFGGRGKATHLGIDVFLRVVFGSIEKLSFAYEFLALVRTGTFNQMLLEHFRVSESGQGNLKEAVMVHQLVPCTLSIKFTQENERQLCSHLLLLPG